MKKKIRRLTKGQIEGRAKKRRVFKKMRRAWKAVKREIMLAF